MIQHYELERLEGELQPLLADYDRGVINNPIEEQARLLGQILGWKDLCADRVAALTDWRYETKTGEQLRAEVAMWERSLDRATKALDAAAKVNLDARRVDLAEAQAALAAAVIVRVLAARGLNAEDVDVRQLVHAELAAVAQEPS